LGRGWGWVTPGVPSNPAMLGFGDSVCVHVSKDLQKKEDYVMKLRLVFPWKSSVTQDI